LIYAFAGHIPLYGLHFDENRNPDIEIKVDADLETINDFGTLGFIIGKEVKGKIPYLTGIKGPVSLDKLKSLGAAAAASGSVKLYHVEGITPEARMKTISLDGLEEELVVNDRDILNAKMGLSKGNPEEIDLVAFGCPHASHREIAEIAKYLDGKKTKPDVDLWICTSRAMKAWSDAFGYTDTIEEAGGKIYCDTCMVVAPIEDIGYKTTATNSGKAAKYLPNFCKQEVVYDRIDKIIEMVVE